MLNIKPILGTTATGEVKPLEKVRTRKKVIPKLVEMTNAYGELAGLSVMYGGDNEADAQALKQELAAHYSGEIIITTIGPAIGTHTGPGVLGVGLLQK